LAFEVNGVERSAFPLVISLDDAIGKNRTRVNASLSLIAHFRGRNQMLTLSGPGWSSKESLGMQLANRKRQHDFCIVRTRWILDTIFMSRENLRALQDK